MTFKTLAEPVRWVNEHMHIITVNIPSFADPFIKWHIDNGLSCSRSEYIRNLIVEDMFRKRALYDQYKTIPAAIAPMMEDKAFPDALQIDQHTYHLVQKAGRIQQ